MTVLSVDEYKAQGNAFFKAEEYDRAADMYTKGLACPDCSIAAVLFTNRAAVNMKREQYGAVISDCDNAIATDPRAPKAYYRRGLAHAALLSFKEAAADFKMLMAIKPNDAKSRSLFENAQKEYKRRKFEAALRVETVSFFKALDLANFTETIPELDLAPGAPVTLDYIKALLDFFRADDRTLPMRHILQLLTRLRETLMTETNLVDLHIPAEAMATAGPRRVLSVFGDFHGQWYDLANAIGRVGFPSTEHRMVFLGDYVDRGSWGVPVFLTIAAMKLFAPKSVIMLRGNHETNDMNTMFGLKAEITQRYHEKLSQGLSEVFAHLPLACLATVGDVDRTFCVHGGLPAPTTKLSAINAFSRTTQPPSSGVFTDLLWADPSPAPGRTPSSRGTSFQFGPDVARQFMEGNRITQVLRAHQMVEAGYKHEFPQGPKLTTVFSAPKYCDFNNNKGAVAFYTGESTGVEFLQYEAVPHPQRPLPMMAANPLAALLQQNK